MPSTVPSTVALLLSSTDLTVGAISGTLAPSLFFLNRIASSVFPPRFHYALPARIFAAQLGLRTWPSHQDAISKLQQKFMLLRPQMKDAYAFANNFSLRCPHPLCHELKWYNFHSFLRNVLLSLCRSEGKLQRDIYVQLDTMLDMLKCMDTYIKSMKCHVYLGFTSYFGALIIRAAHVSYLCWIHQMDEDKSQEIIIMLSDLLKALKPNTPETTQLCFYGIKYDLEFKPQRLAVEAFVNFLIREKDPQLQTIYDGLTQLIMFVLHARAPEEDNVKPLLKDITAAVCKLGSFGYSFHVKRTTQDKPKGTDPAIFWLLDKMELLRAEGKSKAPKLVWLHILTLAREATSIYQSFHAQSVTIGKLRDELLKLQEKIKLLKTEILLEELLNGHPNYVVNVKNEIKSLDQGLIVLRPFLIGSDEENEKFLLTQAESITRNLAFLYDCLLENESTEDTVMKFSFLLPELVKKMNLVNAEIKEGYITVRRSLGSHFPKTEGFGFIDFLLGNLRELLNSEVDYVVSVIHQIHVVHEEIEFLRSFLRDIEEQYKEHQDLKTLDSSIMEVILEAEYLIDVFILGDCLQWYHPIWLSDLIEDLKLVKLQATEICENAHGININNVPTFSRNVISPPKIPKIDEVVIDLADGKKLVIDRLIAGSPQLDVVSIVGMAGLGKTTLALKVYTDPSVIYHFHIRAWCSVSQAYQKRELLLEILGDIVELTDHILEMSDGDLEMKLYQCLKRNRFLIVMDDIWSTSAWYDFQGSFPNDNNGSRILITSRLPDVARKMKVDSAPHPLRLLSNDESWKLFQRRVFDTKKSCKGLPLAVVAISGLLERTDKAPDWWKQVSESICSHIAEDIETRCMDTLELSYRYLPDHLKHCFLYTGVFLEDEDIPVRKLTWLWAVEGFIWNTDQENNEDVAEGYLRDLIGRSLIMTSKKKSLGGVKTCRVHDMLRTLCMLKFDKENILQCQNGYEELFASTLEDLDYGVDPNYSYPTNSITYEKRRLSICSKRNHFVMSRPSGPHVHTLLFSATSDLYPRCPYDISFIFDNFKLLRVLDLECINMGNSFPTGVQLLIHLRYLALCGNIDCIPASISHLRDLETLLVKGLRGEVLLPYTIWSLEKLRHVHVNMHATFTLQDGEITLSPQVLNLVSLSCPYLLCGKGTENIMRRLLKLRKLRCVFSEVSSTKLSDRARVIECTIGRLPNLEVLKLLSRAFEGKVWEMKKGEFHKLKFLKLDNLNIAQWNASSDHLPQLQHLILRSCRQLEESPSAFCESSTLEMIEVQLCTSSVEESVLKLKEELLEMGNEDFKVLIDRSDMDL
ncbi:putative late blight resistance protein homolog R1A-4 [Coffea arabica]|uniref:Late blight resistance protein homolog R1A-4 n=1 Tax=Coffea arabica TaxID=13443 RepID=A0ABM4W8C9_COFAR